jgi:hypothetical protein
VRSITVTIRWREEEQEQATEITLHEGELRTSLSGQKGRELSSGSTKRLPSAAAEKSGKQLLPTDRVILNALCRRVPQGGQITAPVRNGELAAECEISRRQVQICLKRLMEKRLIKRLINESGIGSHAGYRYLVS